MSFDVNVATEYDQWYRQPKGRYADAQEKKLFLRLVQSQRGQSLLEVGCGTGHNLEFFSELGLNVTGIDSSEPMLQMAAKRLGPDARLLLGEANRLAFDNNSFDIVVLIAVLEFLPDPAGALKEAVRVSREKVYIGVLNKTSILGIGRRVKGRFRKSIYNRAKFYTIWEIERMSRRVLGNVSLTWESVLFFPLRWHRYCHRIDRFLSFQRNPFGAFLGICATKFYRTSTHR
jgi:ubiquinone/menaquinone biosynthesis C-methylase UbiE